MNSTRKHAGRQPGRMVLVAMFVLVSLLTSGHIVAAQGEADEGTSMMIEQLGLVPTSDAPRIADSSTMLEELGLVPTSDGPALASAPTLVGSGPDRELVAVEVAEVPTLVGSGPERETVAVASDETAIWAPGLAPR